MKSKVLGIFLAGLILVALSIGNIWAQTPFSINYQGRLTDTATGFTLSNDPNTSADGQIDINVSIYDTSAIDTGTKLWPSDPETERVYTNVSVTDGLFSVLLNIEDSSIFNGQSRYLNVQVQQTDKPIEQLSPRKALVSVPHAVSANTATTINNGTITSSSITLSTTTSTKTGEIAYDQANQRIVVGNGSTTDFFYPGAHTADTDTNTNAATQCSGTTTYFDGEGNCDNGVGNVACTDCVTLGGETVGNYASSTAEGGPANNLACNDCVALGTETTGNFAGSTSEGGPANNVSCTDCVTLGSETTGNYAGSTSEGGAANFANDLSCTNCIGATEITDGLGVSEINETVIQQRVSGNCAVGSSIRAINQDGTVVCEVAAPSISIMSGSYVGNGTSQFISIGGSDQPKMVHIYPGYSGDGMTVKTANMPSNYSSSPYYPAQWITSYITSLDAGGFTVGNGARVNSSGMTYYYVAWF